MTTASARPAPASPTDQHTADPRIRVATVPSSHVYVRHLAPLEEPAAGTGTGAAPSIVRPADPDPDDPRRSAVERWWPPAMLEPEWVRSNDDFDIFHLQFGFDARTPAQLAELVQTLRERGIPFVYTVHDLRNPHHVRREEHDAQLDVLIPAADALITLTPGAAAEIRRRWNREATVLPHPHVVDFPTMQRMQRERADRALGRSLASDPFRVGVHVKSLRASMNPVPVLHTLIEAVRERSNVVLQVDGHPDVLQPGGHRYDEQLAAFLRDADARGENELRVHDYFSDDELWRYLASLDASVLPYRFGTHSGWLEACHDLGTAVLTPDCGFYAEQGPAFGFHHDEDGLDGASLVAALDAAVAASGTRTSVAAPVAERRLQRAGVAAAHLELYRGLLA